MNIRKIFAVDSMLKPREVLMVPFTDRTVRLFLPAAKEPQYLPVPSLRLSDLDLLDYEVRVDLMRMNDKLRDVYAN